MTEEVSKVEPRPERGNGVTPGIGRYSYEVLTEKAKNAIIPKVESEEATEIEIKGEKAHVKDGYNSWIDSRQKTEELKKKVSEIFNETGIVTETLWGSKETIQPIGNDYEVSINNAGEIFVILASGGSGIVYDEAGKGIGSVANLYKTCEGINLEGKITIDGTENVVNIISRNIAEKMFTDTNVTLNREQTIEENNSGFINNMVEDIKTGVELAIDENRARKADRDIILIDMVGDVAEIFFGDSGREAAEEAKEFTKQKVAKEIEQGLIKEVDIETISEAKERIKEFAIQADERINSIKEDIQLGSEYALDEFRVRKAEIDIGMMEVTKEILGFFGVENRRKNCRRGD